MNRACARALAALVLCGVSSAAAQDQLVTTFVPEAHRRWDATGFVGWRGVDKSDLAPGWNTWYDVAAFSASAGRYLTQHVKLDVDLSTTSVGRVYGQTFVSTPGVPFSVPPSYAPPIYTLREYEFRRTTVAAALAYQFLENRWVHPFLGAGVEGVRESEHLQTQFLPTGGPRGSGPIRETQVRYSARPFVSGGVKFYVSERSFIRTDMLTTLSSGGAESAVWRVGAGVDF
jgi:opacity protein-like surface antigen